MDEAERIVATIMGCGSSGGVPRIGGNWGACDPAEPKNRRRRCSLLVEERAGEAVTRLLVDTSPDLRVQLLDAGVGTLDAVLYTHDHADQTHGIDDLRGVAINKRGRIDVYADDTTARTLTRRFAYCFDQPPGSPYPAILRLHSLPPPGAPLLIAGKGGTIEALPFLQDHGTMPSLGFRFGPLGYSSDLVGLPEESFALLAGVHTWIVDCLRYEPHPTHAHLALALEWIARLEPKRAILTNLHIDLDYRRLAAELPRGVEPAYDGMTLDFDRRSAGDTRQALRDSLLP